MKFQKRKLLFVSAATALWPLAFVRDAFQRSIAWPNVTSIEIATSYFQNVEKLLRAVGFDGFRYLLRFGLHLLFMLIQLVPRPEQGPYTSSATGTRIVDNEMLSPHRLTIPS